MGLYSWILMLITISFFTFITIATLNNNERAIKILVCGKDIANWSIYYMLMFLSALIYIGISMELSDLDGVLGNFDAAICAVCLLAIVWIMNRFFELLLKENSLNKWDKCCAIAVSYVGVIIVGIILAVLNDSIHFLSVSSIAISTLIGCFIPIAVFVENVSLKNLYARAVETLELQKQKMKIVAVYFFCMIVLLCLSFMKCEPIMTQMKNGFVAGFLVFFVSFCIYIKIQSKKYNRIEKNILAKLKENDIQLFLKFGKKEHLKSFANGDLFFSNAKVFWGIEDAIKLKGQGDRLEASSMFHAEKVIGYSLDNQERFVDMGRCHGLVRYDTAEKIPVLCLFAVHSDDCIVDSNGKIGIKLTPETKKVIQKHFPNADAVAIIKNPGRFLFDIEMSIDKEIEHDLVRYFHIEEGIQIDNGNVAMDLQYMEYLTKDTPPVRMNGLKRLVFSADYIFRILFCKDVYFEEEQEYRLLLPKETIDENKIYPVKYTQKIEIEDLSIFFESEEYF